MRKIFFLAAALISLHAAAQFQGDWLTDLHSDASGNHSQSNWQSVDYYSDGDALVFGSYGSYAATDKGHLVDTTFLGADYGGGGNASSYNSNMLLAKLDTDGQVVWALHSEAGEIELAGSVVTPTSDGGALLAIKFRHQQKVTSGENAPLYTIVDATNTPTTLQMANPGMKTYQPAIIRVNANGEITKVLNLTASYAKSESMTSNPTSVFKWAGIVEDAEGNVYVSGLQSLDLTIGTTTIAARQTSWNGDAQTYSSNCNTFVIKLDSDLGYVKHIVGGGNLTFDSGNSLSYVDGNLYMVGLYQSEAVNFTLGGQSLTLAEKQYGHYVAKLNTNLQAQYINNIPVIAHNGKQAVLPYHVSFSADNQYMYITTRVMGGVVVGNDTLRAGGTMNNGAVVRVNLSDGSADKGVIRQQSTINLSVATFEIGDSIYVINYGPMGTTVEMRYDKDFGSESVKTLATGGGMSTVVTAAAHDNQLLVGLRAKGSTNFTVMDSVINVTSSWYAPLFTYSVQQPTEPVVPEVPVDGETAFLDAIQSATFAMNGDDLVYTIVLEPGHSFDIQGAYPYDYENYGFNGDETVTYGNTIVVTFTNGSEPYEDEIDLYLSTTSFTFDGAEIEDVVIIPCTRQGTSTGVSEARQNEAIKKSLHRGVLLLQKEGHVYNAQGQLVR